MTLIDTHCHLYSTEFGTEQQEVVDRAKAVGVQRFYLPAIDSETHTAMMAIEERFKGHCYAMIGMHPCSVKADYKNELAGVLSQLDDGNYVFSYVERWFSDVSKPSISLTLPKSKIEFQSSTLFPFFFNLIPEGVNKRLVCSKKRIDLDDYFGILLEVANGDNIGAATMFVATGAADIGFTALSLAQSPEIAKQTHYVLVDDKLYEPIMQRMVLIKGAPQGAIDLYQFMQTATAKAILAKYGYGVPK